jgi:serine/threonine-protein kinase
VVEVDDDPFGVYLVMDYVEGDSLAGLMRAAKAAKMRMPLPIVARILTDTLSGLHAAHELTDDRGNLVGLVHRDCTPQNVLIGTDGVSRLSDFSVAKAADRAVRTRTGLVKGKIAYMSPEQARGHSVDRRCDVWAAGIVAWELIAWRRLHKNVDAVSTLLSVVTEAPPALRDVAPDVAPALDEVIARALQMDPEKRTPSALALRRELDDAFRATCGIADTQEVRELMTTLFGQKLRERRERAAEVRRLRVQLGEIARPTDSDPEESPLSSAPRHRRPDESELTRPDSPAALPAPEPAGQTDHALSTASILAAKPRRRLVAVVGAALTAAVVGLFAMLGLPNADQRPAEAAREPVAPAAAPLAPLPPPAQPIAAPAADAAPPVQSSVPATASATRAASRPAPTRAPPRSAPTRFAAPGSRAPTELAKDPYGAQ